MKLSPVDEPGLIFNGIQLLGTLELDASLSPVVPLHELSGLAWDETGGTLWAVSDRGWLFSFLPLFNTVGYLVDLRFLSVRKLEAAGRPVHGPTRDAEGLVLFYDRDGLMDLTRFAVSYEQNPRIVVHDRHGRALRTLHAPALENLARYDEANHALEALTLHPSLGWITAPERSVNKASKGQIPLWQAERDEPLGIFVGLGGKRSALVALEALADGRILALERKFRRKRKGRGKGQRLQTALYLFRPVPGRSPLKVKRLVLLDTDDGWQHDNYEGLTRHVGNRFFMVSDDNGGKPQRTLLTYFAVPTLATTTLGALSLTELELAATAKNRDGGL